MDKTMPNQKTLIINIDGFNFSMKPLTARKFVCFHAHLQVLLNNFKNSMDATDKDSEEQLLLINARRWYTYNRLLQFLYDTSEPTIPLRQRSKYKKELFKLLERNVENTLTLFRKIYESNCPINKVSMSKENR